MEQPERMSTVLCIYGWEGPTNPIIKMPLGKTGCLWGTEPAETFLPEGSLLGGEGLDLSIPTPTRLVYLWVIHEPCPDH